VFKANNDGATCAISVDGKDLREFWTFKAHHGGTYYPAVPFSSFKM
jgi:hypothetical protein